MGYSIPSLVYFGQLLDPTNFLYFRKYNKRISRYFRSQKELFSRQAIPKILFVLHSRYPWDTPYQVWFNLDNSLTRRNFYIFENRISEEVDISDRNTNFFLGKLFQKFFWFYNLGTHGILHTKFGLIWTTP